MQFLLSVVKQVSHIAVTFLDQNGRAKEKISRPRNRSEGVLGYEQSSYAVQGRLLACEMDLKTTTALVLCRPKIKQEQ